MKHIPISFVATLCAVQGAVAQPDRDTTTILDEVKVSAYFAEQPLLRLTGSAGVISSTTLANQSGVTLLPAFNTVPGVRMEERSPGSYRLSIRGSLLRSPFGVRNVKIYVDEIPLTDAGGNTYLNMLDPGGINSMEVLKGPDGSLFGANSGGIVRIRPVGMAPADRTASLRFNGGSYGLFHQQLSAVLNPSSRYQFAVNQAYQRSDGYRENTAMRRTALQTVHRWHYSPEREIRLVALYSDLNYRTPGGLTADQYAEDPRQARPGTAVVPGAVEQRAGISNRTLIGGVVHDARFSAQLKHVASVFGMHTDFSNPFITNYEVRDEYSVGFRTYFDYTGGAPGAFSWRANLGMEWQHGGTDVANYDNNGGSRGDQQAIDDLRSGQHFYFARFAADFRERLSLEAAISLNHYGYRYISIFPANESDFTRRRFDPQWMPKVALSYLLNPRWAWRASVSKGYSPPTIAEVRPSDNQVNTALAAETGWNYETGFRWQLSNRRVFLDGSVFYYLMDDAIIRQLRENGAEYFANAGKVDQRGLEFSADAWAIAPRSAGVLQGLQLGTNLTLSRFRFDEYQVGEDVFTGNKLTGVPAATIVSSVRAQFPRRLTVYLLHHYTSSVPLDDGNTMFADRYHLLQSKVSWERPLGKSLSLQLFAGVDNLLNERYSLGNDINAFGGRYFNAAAPRNFYGGAALGISKNNPYFRGR
jgi:Outer membrane receptor proteins, mostly Fe transport